MKNREGKKEERTKIETETRTPSQQPVPELLKHTEQNQEQYNNISLHHLYTMELDFGQFIQQMEPHFF